MRFVLRERFDDRNELLEVLLGLRAFGDRIERWLDASPDDTPVEAGPWLEVGLGLVAFTRRLRAHLAVEPPPTEDELDSPPPPRGLDL